MQGGLIFMEGRADISGGEGRYFWKGVFMFVEGRAEFVEGRADIYGG